MKTMVSAKRRSPNYSVNHSQLESANNALMALNGFNDSTTISPHTNQLTSLTPLELTQNIRLNDKYQINSSDFSSLLQDHSKYQPVANDKGGISYVTKSSLRKMSNFNNAM